jgi:hypothetical protein
MIVLEIKAVFTFRPALAKKAQFFAENWTKSQKITITTLTP